MYLIFHTGWNFNSPVQKKRFCKTIFLSMIELKQTEANMRPAKTICIFDKIYSIFDKIIFHMVLFLTNSDALGSTNNFRNWVNDSTFLKSNEFLTDLDEWNIRLLFLRSVNAEIFFQRWKKGHIKDMFWKETFFVFWGWSVVYLKLYAAYIIKIHYRHHCHGF